jgi:hypothetical protein
MFKCFPIVAKNAFWLYRVHSSVHLSAYFCAAQTELIFVKVDVANTYKNMSKQNLVKIGPKYSVFCMKTYLRITVNVDKKKHKISLFE